MNSSAHPNEKIIRRINDWRPPLIIGNWKKRNNRGTVEPSSRNAVIIVYARYFFTAYYRRDLCTTRAQFPRTPNRSKSWLLKSSERFVFLFFFLLLFVILRFLVCTRYRIHIRCPPFRVYIIRYPENTYETVCARYEQIVRRRRVKRVPHLPLKRKNSWCSFVSLLFRVEMKIRRRVRSNDFRSFSNSSSRRACRIVNYY